MEMTSAEIISGTPEINLEKKLRYILEKKNKSLYESFGDSVINFNPGLFPMDVRSLFPNYRAYVLELGSGWGDFAIQYARNNSSTFYIAMDKKRYRIKKSVSDQRKSTNQGFLCNNLKWMVCNFEWIFSDLFTADTFDMVVINFPDPWPKKRHQKHRFVKTEFIQHLRNILKPDGIVEFATDNWSYMESVISDFENCGDWLNINGPNIIYSRIPGRPVSFFENLKRNEKENIYIIQLKKSCA